VQNKSGSRLERMIIKDVAIVPTSKYNVLSLTKAMEGRWTLKGSNNKLTSTKGEQKNVFNIAINTPKGVIYVIYIERAKMK
jgi:hypothetical protein